MERWYARVLITVFSLANDKLVFELVNAELKANSRLTFPVIIWCYGGISSLQFGARGPNGASANVDFHFAEHTPPAVQTAFRDALTAVYNANRNNLAHDFMNTEITRFITSESRREITQSSVYEALWKPNVVTGSRLRLLHGPFGVSLAEKMDKMTNEIIQDGTHREKNLQDAVGFLQGGSRAEW
jgi:hypothetical protein